MFLLHNYPCVLSAVGQSVSSFSDNLFLYILPFFQVFSFVLCVLFESIQIATCSSLDSAGPQIENFFTYPTFDYFTH